MTAFQIEEQVGAGGPKTKAHNNLAAIRLLKDLEVANRRATDNELIALSQYIGWGGLPQIFESPPKPEWEQEASELRSLLSREEYEAARVSTLNAHYTSREVITAIYDGLEYLGFRGGRMLEPAVGAGNFIGLQPQDMRWRSQWTATELDQISCHIAQQLYPEADIRHTGFEKLALADNSFDAVVTNVPFGDYSLHESRYNELNLRIHNHFLAKSVDLIRPGGLVVAITSTGTMQSSSGQEFREWMAQRTNLVGAMRLPSDAFKGNALTEVTTDLLILQKLEPGAEPQGETWLKLEDIGVLGKDGQPLMTNEYYVRHPEMLLGIPGDDRLHPGRLALMGDGRDLRQALHDAFNRLSSGIYLESDWVEREQAESLISIPAGLKEQVKLYGYIEYEGQLYKRVDESHLKSVEAELGTTRAARMRGILPIRDSALTVFEAQLSNSTDEDLLRLQQQLNDVYDSFVNKYGPINSVGNRRVIIEDPDSPLLFALEHYDGDTKTAQKADIFSKRVVQPYQAPTSAGNAKEALLHSLNERGWVDLDYLQQLTGKQESEVIGELKGLIYLDPKTKQWLPQDDYLSGNVRDKLEVARIAAEQDDRFSENVEALLAVQPQDLLPGDIDVQLGAPWLATEDIRDFAAHLLEVPEDQTDAITVHHSPFLAAWTVKGDYSLNSSFANTSTYGTARCTALDLIDKALNLKDPRVYDYDQDKRAILNTTETEAAREKLQKIKYEFERWVWRDPDRCERLVAKYNALYNNRRLREYDGSHLRLPGMSPHWEQKLHPHQRNAIWRCLQSSEPVLLAHCVGAGKTAEMTGAAMEAKRLGLLGENGKALIVVPNHMLEQVSGDFLKIYPAAKALAITKDQLQKGKREALINRIATNNWDAVIITHKSFERIPLSSEAKLTFYHQEAARIEEAIAQTDGSNRGLVKRQESAKRRLDKRIEQATEDKDNTLSWEHLIEAGVRMVLIDEAHAYKNLAFQTQMDSISGLNPDGSDRAFDLLMKIRYLQEQGGRTVFATATPSANSIAEAYTWERYCGSDEPFDAWAATFTNPTTNAEIGPTGTYKMRTVLAEYKNLPELMTRFRQFADVRTADQIKLPRPKVNYVNVAVEASPEQLEYMDSLVQRAEKLQRGGVDPRDDNALKIFHEGREVMLHQQLRDPTLPDYPDNKLAVLASNVTQIWNETVAIRGTQLIFSDLGTPTKEGFSVYEYIRNQLLEQGIPAEEIAFIHDYDSDTKKDKLFEDVRQGRIRVLLGSTEKMGCGTNVQTRCVAIHHADIPFRPCDREQRDGRALRPGNLNEQIEIYTYVTQGRGNNAGLEAYMAQLNERKASFINKMMVGDLTERRAELDSKEQMSFGELKAIASGNPLIQKKVEVDAEVIKLRRLRQAHEDELYGIRLQLQQLPQKIELLRKEITGLRTDLQSLHDTSGDRFYMTVKGRVFDERARAGEQINAISASLIRVQQFGRHDIGDLSALKLAALLHPGDRDVTLALQGQLSYYVAARQTPMGTIYALEHQLRKIPETLEKAEEELAKTEQRYVAMRQSLGLEPASSLDKTAELIAEVKSFPLPVFQHTQGLERLCEIQAELDRALGLGFDESGQDLTPDENYQLPADLEALLNRSAGGQQSAQTYVPSLELAQTQLDSVFELPQQVTAEDLSSLTSAISDNDASSFLEDTVSGEEIEAVELRHESPQEALSTETSKLLPKVVESELEKPLTESAPAASAVPASPAQITVAPQPVPQTDIQLSLFESSPNVVPDASLPLVQSEARPENLLAQTPAIAHSTADVVHDHKQVDTIQRGILLQQNPDASTLISLSTWRRVAESLGKSDAYINRIDSVTAEFHQGQRLSPQAHTAWENDLKLYQAINHSLNKWSRAASALGKSDAYLARIADVTAQFGNGYPLSTQAQTAMQKDFESYSKFQSLLSTWQRVAQTLGRSDSYLQRLAAVMQNLDSGESLTAQAQLSMQKDFQTHGQLQKSLLDWQRVAIALGKADAYVQRIAVVAREFETGQPLSQPAKTALQQDFATYKELQSHLKQWYEVAQTIGKPAQYLNRIQKVASSFRDAQSPSPLSQKAIAAMHQDLYSYQQQTRSKSQINRDLVSVEI